MCCAAKNAALPVVHVLPVVGLSSAVAEGSLRTPAQPASAAATAKLESEGVGGHRVSLWVKWLSNEHTFSQLLPVRAYAQSELGVVFCRMTALFNPLVRKRRVHG